ncbi:hypothetical protein A4X06_0g9382, partial [Tilletia controversa]
MHCPSAVLHVSARCYPPSPSPGDVSAATRMLPLLPAADHSVLLLLLLVQLITAHSIPSLASAATCPASPAARTGPSGAMSRYLGTVRIGMGSRVPMLTDMRTKVGSVASLGQGRVDASRAWVQATTSASGPQCVSSAGGRLASSRGKGAEFLRASAPPPAYLRQNSALISGRIIPSAQDSGVGKAGIIPSAVAGWSSPRPPPPSA